MTPTISYTGQPPYLFPPRPENAVHPRFLPDYDNGTYIAEPKLDGDCAVIFKDGTETIVRDRHNKPFSKDTRALDTIARQLHTGNGWCVLVGEFMAKGKRNADGQNMNGSLVLFDILVSGGLHLGEYTFQDRHTMLRELYGSEEYDGFILRGNLPGLFVVKAFEGSTGDEQSSPDGAPFVDLFERVTAISMYEGLVLKRKDAKLELGVRPLNNHLSQVKFRRPAKNYHY